MIVGYARVSTEEQNLDLQLEALHRAGCDRIYSDHGLSGSIFDRPGLQCANECLGPNGVLVVWRLDRLGRSLTKLVQFVEDLGRRGVEFRSLTENIDTMSSGGRLVFHIMAALAEFERSLVSERTRAGLEAARRRGQRLGRRPSITQERLIDAQDMLRSGLSMESVAQHLQVTLRTLKRSL